jgi:PAS domain S-box-containing protein
MRSTKEKLISEFRKRVEKMASINEVDQKIADQQIAILLGELQIAQIELEMQNDELGAASEILENERSKFASFFNNAPVAYFILDYLGTINEINEFGISLLGIKKQVTTNLRIQSFIHNEDLEKFYLFLQSMRPEGEKQSIEIKMMLTNVGQKYVRVEGVAFFKSFTSEIQYYIAVIDITKERHEAQATFELQEEKQRLVLSTTIDAQEKERQKISSVLHDSICQLLYGIRLNMQHIQHDKQSEEYKNVNQLLGQAIKETRQLSYELAPSILRDFGFVEAVREMVDRLRTPTFKITLQIAESTDLLASELQLTIFRMVQELLNNSIKHANASKAKIEIIVNELIRINFKDDGQGFPADLDKALAKGSGLRGIKNRVFLLNGEIDFLSDNGAEIDIRIKKEI